MGDIICRRVAAGESATIIGQDLGISPATISSWSVDDTLALGFPERYARARLQRGEYYGQKVTEIAQDAIDGKVDPNAARVAIDAYKWTAARMTPKTYGDHSSKQITLDAGPGFATLLEEIDRRRAPMIEVVATDITDE